MTRRAFPSTFVADEMVQVYFGIALTVYSAAKLLLLLLVDLQSHSLILVQISIFCIVLPKRVLTIKQSEPLNLGLEILLTKKKEHIKY